VRRIVGEIGLRFRPTAQTDLEAHAARIALLACDVADIPVHLLRQAANAWVQNSRFMPTASELIEAARSFMPKLVVVNEAPNKQGILRRIDLEYQERMQRARNVKEYGDVWEWERQAKIDAGLPVPPRPQPLSRVELDHLPDHIKSLGIANGCLEYRGGELVECAI
jgi:hypothetical protein